MAVHAQSSVHQNLMGPEPSPSELHQLNVVPDALGMSGWFTAATPCVPIRSPRNHLAVTSRQSLQIPAHFLAGTCIFSLRGGPGNRSHVHTPSSLGVLPPAFCILLSPEAFTSS